MNRRLFFSRVLGVGVLALALVSRPAWGTEPRAAIAFETAGFALLLLAALGRLWTTAFIGGRKRSVLVTEGPYSVMRHPLYGFSLVGFIGTGLAFGSLTIAGLLGVTFALTHWPTMRAEDAWLRARFGQDFERYARAVPSLLPAPHRFRTPEILHVDSSVFARAVIESAAVLAVFPIARVAAWAHAAGILPAVFPLP